MLTSIKFNQGPLIISSLGYYPTGSLNDTIIIVYQILSSNEIGILRIVYYRSSLTAVIYSMI